MPWSNQSGGGGWKGGGNGGGPWGQGPRTPGSTPPDLEELLRRSQDRLKKVLPSGGGGFSPLAMVAAALVAVALIGWLFFTFQVQANELGVVLRFGKVDRTAAPGLNFRLPYPIEAVYTPQALNRVTETIGISQDGRGGVGREIPSEALMLTGDENIVDINFSLFWVIRDAQAYLFNLQDPRGTVKAVAESAIREVVGRSEIEPLLTGQRQSTELAVQQLMQSTLDGYKAGIQIAQVQLLKVDPPGEVIASFRDVQAARADQERFQNEAQTYANQVVPAANGQASQIVAQANAYRDQVTALAQGKADRFKKIYDQYRLAPDVTRERIYLETMEGILGGLDKVIVDQPGGQSVIPYLPLPDIGKPTSAPAAPRTASQTGTANTSATGVRP